VRRRPDRRQQQDLQHVVQRRVLRYFRTQGLLDSVPPPCLTMTISFQRQRGILPPSCRRRAGRTFGRAHPVRPGLPIARIQNVEDVVNADRRFAQAAATVGLAIGLAALFLSAVGIFGMLAFTVAQQRGELGVRLALGATPRGVFGRVLKRGVTLGALGAALGLPPAILLGLELRGLALGSRPLDPVMLVAVTGVIMLVVTLAAIPAARAAALSPSEALSGG